MKILIGIPCMGSIRAETVGSISQMLISYKNLDFRVIIYANSLIYDARNAILNDFLKSDADYLLFLDSDIIFPADAVAKLVNLKKGVATGIYYTRSENVHKPVIYSEIIPRGIFNHLPKGTAFTGQIEGLQRVLGCGMGFCLIRRDIAEKISKRFISPFEPYKGLGEDLSFCYRLKKIREPIYAVDLGLKHVGIKHFTAKEP